MSGGRCEVRIVRETPAIDEPEVIGARLKALRLAFGYERASQFCRFVDVSDKAWNHYECGRRRIPIKEAVKVVEKTGVTLNWIYLGVEHTLPPHVAEKLRGDGQSRG